MTAFFCHEDFAKHFAPRQHPERPQRLQAISAALSRSGLWDGVTHHEFASAGVQTLRLCHSEAMIARARQSSAQSLPLDGDTYTNADSYAVACLVVGAACAAVDAVLDGAARNALVCARPPGHHAESNRSMGFCLFNAVAIAARHAQRKHGLERVAIVDWDVHHGNGTQEIFYDDASVFFASVHESPLYPFSGARHETGAGEAMGTTWNFPLPAHSTDGDYALVWQMLEAALHEFKPQMILVSAGFDAHFNDPLGHMKVTPAGFAHLMKTTKRWAHQWCDGRLVAVLEGGYDLTGLTASFCAVLQEMLAA